MLWFRHEETLYIEMMNSVPNFFYSKILYLLDSRKINLTFIQITLKRKDYLLCNLS